MVPIRLLLHNFRSFAGPVEIRFDYAPLICIVGDNGAGKSSIVEAMLWALFGASREGKGNSRAVMRLGTSQVTVEFDFRTLGGTYRVVRSVGRRNRLKVYDISGDEPRPLVKSNRINDAKEVIRTLVGASYDELRAATVFMQNEAGVFSTLDPAPRRKLLAQMLGISRYAHISERAHNRARQLERGREELELRRQELVERIETFGDVEGELEDVSARLSEAERRFNALTKELDVVNEKLAQLSALEQKFSAQKARASDVKSMLEELSAELESCLCERERLLGIVAREKEIEGAYAEYRSLSEEDGRLSAAAAELAELRRRLSELERRASRAKQEHERKIGSLRGKIEQMRAELEALDAELSSSSEVAAGVERLSAARSMLDDLVRKRERAEQLRRRMSEAQAHIDEERAQLARRLEELSRRAARLEEELAEREGIEAELAQIERKIAEANDAAQRASVLRDDISRLDAEIAALRGAESSLAEERAKAKDQLSFVVRSDSPRCPLCGSDLSGERRDELERKLAAQIEQLSAEAKEVRRRLAEHIRRRDELKSELAEADAKTKAVGRLSRRRDELLSRAAQLRQVEAELLEVRASCREISETMERGAYAVSWRAALSEAREELRRLAFSEEAFAEAKKLVDELSVWEGRWAVLQRQRERAERLRRELKRREDELASLESTDPAAALLDEAKALERRIGEISYDPARHRDVRARLEELAGAAEEFAALEQAKKRLPELEERIAALERRLDSLRDEAARIEEELSALSSKLGERCALVARRDELTEALADARREVDDLREHKARAQEKLAQLQRLKQDEASISQRIKELGEEESLYHLVSELTGPLGIQDWLMRRYLSAIEAAANETLSVITDGALRLSLVPEEGEKLVVCISDALGERPYKSFSGGEGFRIDFALRLALAKVLAQRAGFPLRTLIIDEGFGSQDQKGLNHLIDAIYDIQPQFDCIIVVTHIPALREAFPVRLEVEKTPQGSRVTFVS